MQLNTHLLRMAVSCIEAHVHRTLAYEPTLGALEPSGARPTAPSWQGCGIADSTGAGRQHGCSEFVSSRCIPASTGGRESRSPKSKPCKTPESPREAGAGLQRWLSIRHFPETWVQFLAPHSGSQTLGTPVLGRLLPNSGLRGQQGCVQADTHKMNPFNTLRHLYFLVSGGRPETNTHSMNALLVTKAGPLNNCS